MNISVEIDASFGSGPEEGPVHALVSDGHRALRRRRLASACAGAVVAVVVGGSAVFASVGGSERAGGPDRDVVASPTPTETSTPFEPTRREVNRAMRMRLAEYDASGRLVVDGRARVVQRLTNPYDIPAPGKSAALVVGFRGTTYWFSMYRRADGSNGWSSIWSGDARQSFADWVSEGAVDPDPDPDPDAGGDDAWPGIPDLDLVRFAGTGEVLEPVDGVTILEQRPSPAVGDAFASASDRSAVALVRDGDGARFYVLARSVDGTAPEFIAVKAADAGPTLDAFLDLARERYAGGEGLL